MLSKASRPKMTQPFWAAFLLTYGICFVSLYGIVTVPLEIFDPNNSLEAGAAYKLTIVRASFILICLITYPALLWTSLRWAKYFVFGATAWAVAMYIDDYLVLYRIIEYPERGLVTIIQAIRPLLILSLLWMSFELTMKPPVK